LSNQELFPCVDFPYYKKDPSDCYLVIFQNVVQIMCKLLCIKVTLSMQIVHVIICIWSWKKYFI
jgi:hypothetical protein